MGAYNVELTRTAHATNGVAVYQHASTASRRILIAEYAWGYAATPADAAVMPRMQRSTTAPSGGDAFTPVALNPADGAATALAMGGAVTNGTLTANAYVGGGYGMNQRATFRWVAREGDEVIVPITNSAGIHFLTPTTPTVTVNWGITIKE